VSYVHTQSRGADESQFIRAVEHAIDTRGFHVSDTDHPILASEGVRFSIIPSVAHSLSGSFQERVAQFIGDVRGRTLLSGLGGDNILWSQVTFPPQLADYIVRGRLGQFHQNAIAWALELETTYWELLFKSVAAALGFDDRPWRPRDRRHNVKPPLIHEQHLSRRPVVLERWNEYCVNAKGVLPSKRHEAASIVGAILIVATGYLQTWPFESTFPFLDRELIEFCVAIPTEEKVAPGRTRSLHRNALGAYLPRVVAERTDKASLLEAHSKALLREKAHIRELAANSELVARGYVNERAFGQAVEGIAKGFGVDTTALLRVVSLERWFRDARRHGFQLA
jgi:asparagine synthetase B (glutamine-hydrolysing)